MDVIVVLSLAAVVFLSWRLYSSSRKVASLRFQLLAGVPYIRSQAGPNAQLDFLFNFDDWELVESGGNNQAGNIGGLGLCPCQKEYTVNTQQTFFAQRPNAQQLQNCLNNPPPEAPPAWKCPDDCVQVMTHRWRGFDVLRNKKTGQFLLNCHRFAQYHCKKPNDPARETPPVEEPPPPDIEG
jgi:hypothetical protein